MSDLVPTSLADAGEGRDGVFAMGDPVGKRSEGAVE